MNYGSSKSAKIVLSKSIFDVKNQLNFFQKIRWPKPKPINEKLQLRPINRLIGRPLLFDHFFQNQNGDFYLISAADKIDWRDEIQYKKEEQNKVESQKSCVKRQQTPNSNEYLS